MLLGTAVERNSKQGSQSPSSSRKSRESRWPDQWIRPLRSDIITSFTALSHITKEMDKERERERRTEMTFLEYMLIPFIMEASIKSLDSFRFSIELLYATVSKNRNRLSSRTDMNSTRSQMNQMKQSSLLLKVQLVRLVMLVKIKVKKVGF